jgi:hypothetical protein
LDEDSFKSIKKKLKRDDHEGQVEEHASNHVEDVCIKDDTPSEITDEANDTSVLDRYNHDEVFKSTKDEDATSCPTYEDYEEMF